MVSRGSERGASSGLRGLKLQVALARGEVVEMGGDCYGDAVNVAARVQSVAGAGGITISERVYDDMRNRKGMDFEFLGEKQLKNVNRPIRIYNIIDRELIGDGPPPPTREGKAAAKPESSGGGMGRLIPIGIGVIAIGGAAAFFLLRSEPTAPTPEPTTSAQQPTQTAEPGVTDTEPAPDDEEVVAGLAPNEPAGFGPIAAAWHARRKLISEDAYRGLDAEPPSDPRDGVDPREADLGSALGEEHRRTLNGKVALGELLVRTARYTEARPLLEIAHAAFLDSLEGGRWDSAATPLQIVE